MALIVFVGVLLVCLSVIQTIVLFPIHLVNWLNVTHLPLWANLAIALIGFAWLLGDD